MGAVKSRRNRQEDDAGEVASWLILAAGLCLAALFASAALTMIIDQLTSNVATAAAGELPATSSSDPAMFPSELYPASGFIPVAANADDLAPPLAAGAEEEPVAADESITADEPPPVVQADLALADPNGRLMLPEVNPDFASRVVLVIADLQAQDYDVIVHMTHRSNEEQNALYCQSRTTGICAGTGITGPQVTGAQAGESWHNYGLAADLVVRTPNGNPSWPDPDPFWDALGAAAEAQGLSWGGGSGDRPHVEYHPASGDGFISASELQEPYAQGGLEAAWEAAGATQ